MLLLLCLCLWILHHDIWNFGIRTPRVLGMQVDAMDLIEPMVFTCILLTKFARLFIISFTTFVDLLLLFPIFYMSKNSKKM